jgi:copper oxidase (laccase) domain-containing protein
MTAISRRYPAMGERAQTEPAGKWHIDLPECNRLQLLQAGLPSEAVGLSGICTYQQYHAFFSARRLGIRSGRIFTGIMKR